MLAWGTMARHGRHLLICLKGLLLRRDGTPNLFSSVSNGLTACYSSYKAVHKKMSIVVSQGHNAERLHIITPMDLHWHFLEWARGLPGFCKSAHCIDAGHPLYQSLAFQFPCQLQGILTGNRLQGHSVFSLCPLFSLSVSLSLSHTHTHTQRHTHKLSSLSVCLSFGATEVVWRYNGKTKLPDLIPCS
jgi:hypothetical protein